jgi:cytoskeletal protein RodZ
MNETPHPAVVARRRRLHQLRVRIATGVVGLFIAIFSVIYAQTPSTAKTTTTANRVASSSTSTSSTASTTTATPMTTSQS